MPEPQVRSSLWDLETLPAAGQNYIIDLVNLILSEAHLLSASDIHLQPTADGLEVRWRIDGVLQLAGILLPGLGAQRGRPAEGAGRTADLSDRRAPGGADPRVGRRGARCGSARSRPLFGEKAVVRLFARPGRFLRLDDLGLPAEIRRRLVALLGETSGAILLSGPAGSGKTTTIYACLARAGHASGGGGAW